MKDSTRAIEILAKALLTNCPPFDEADQLCDKSPTTPETCRSCWRKYFESEVADENTNDCG